MKKITILTLAGCLIFFSACDKEEGTVNNNNTNNTNNTNNNNSNNNNSNNNNNTNNNNNNSNNNNNNNIPIDSLVGCYDGKVNCNGTLSDASAEVMDSTSTIFLVDLAYNESLNFDDNFYAVLNTATEFSIPQQPDRQSATGALVHGQGVFRNDSLIIYTFLNNASLHDYPCNYFLGKISCGP